MGGFGGGNLIAGSTAACTQVPFHIPNDKALVQISFGDDDGGSAKLNIGTLYSLAKPLEEKAAQNGESLTITAYGKFIAVGKAGQAHHYTFEFPEEDPKHTVCLLLPHQNAQDKGRS